MKHPDSVGAGGTNEAECLWVLNAAISHFLPQAHAIDMLA